MLNLLAYAWAGFGATFGPVLLLPVLVQDDRPGGHRRHGDRGLVVIIWKPLAGGLFDLYEIIPGFVLSLLAIWLASRLGGGPKAGVEEDFARIARHLP